jgi:hypothetical protein
LRPGIPPQGKRQCVRRAIGRIDEYTAGVFRPTGLSLAPIEVRVLSEIATPKRRLGRSADLREVAASPGDRSSFGASIPRRAAAHPTAIGRDRPPSSSMRLLALGIACSLGVPRMVDDRTAGAANKLTDFGRNAGTRAGRRRSIVCLRGHGCQPSYRQSVAGWDHQRPQACVKVAAGSR